MKVSIITVCYNASRTIRETIESVLSQTYGPIEYIIIDGASNDHTMQIVNEYRERVSYAVSEPDGGLYDAMNKGIAASTGEVVGILNADDIYENSGVISDVMKLFESRKISGVYGDLRYFEEKKRYVRVWKAGRFARERFLWGWMPPHPTLFLSREIYRRYGSFRTDFSSAADYEFILRVLYKGNERCFYLPQFLIRMRTGGASDVSLSNRFAVNRRDLAAWKVNGLKPHFFTVFLKPIRKIHQYFLACFDRDLES